MKYLLVLTLLLGGCAEFRSATARNTAEAARAKYEVSAWEYCNTQTSGYLLRMGEQERQEFIDYCLRIL